MAEGAASAPVAAPAALRPTLRYRDLTLFYIVAILSVRWVATAASAGPGTLLVWVMALLCLFVPLAYAVVVLAARYPQQGGLYVWIREAFGDQPGFLSAWTYWMSNLPYFPAVLYFGAGSALFAAGRRGLVLSSSPTWYMGFAVFWLVVITGLNVAGMHAGKWLNNFCSIGGALLIAILVVLAILSALQQGSATHFTATSLVPHLTLRNAIFWSTIFFALAGCETGSFMGEEIVDARRVLPRALLTAGCVITIAYIAGTAALLVALPSSSLNGVDGFMRGIAQLCAQLHAPWLVPTIALLVTINAVGGAAGYLSATSRLPFVAGIDRYLPAAFGSIHPRFRTPWVALVVYGFAGVLVAILGQAGTSVHGAYDVLVSMSVITMFIPYLFLFLALIRLVRRPGAFAVGQVPGGVPVAIALASLGFLSTVVTILLSAIPPPEEPNQALAIGKLLLSSAGVLLAGAIVFALGAHRKRRLASLRASG